MKAPGNNLRNVGAPYSAAVTSFAAATNVATLCPNAQNACTGLLVVVTTGGTLVWKDCAGTTVTTTLPIGVFDLPIAVQSIEISTMVGTVVIYWHPSNGGL